MVKLIKKKSILKNDKKNQNQHVLTIETHDPSNEPETNPIKSRPKK